MRLEQLALPFASARGRGGARSGAGRKRLPAHLRRTPHRARPVHCAAHPVHVTLRAVVRSLRHEFIARTLVRALRGSSSEHFRVVHYSVQDNHVHLVVEAESARRLSAGVRGLMVRVARRVNPLLFRRGRFWADRWHGRALKSPREVRNALVYVLQNRMKHAPGSNGAALDLLSSAAWFDGFSEPPLVARQSVGPPSTMMARTWLLKTGWQRRGLIHPLEAPKAR
jgi:putative transposase